MSLGFCLSSQLTSQIKHVDEETGQIKENVWEFQHPSFQAGGKADLDSIKVRRKNLWMDDSLTEKRKAVVPKKGTAEDREASPAIGARSGGLNPDDQARVLDHDNRLSALEDLLYKTQSELTESRSREQNVMSLLREVVGHVVSVDKGELPPLFYFRTHR